MNVIDHPCNRQVIATLLAIYYVYAPSWGQDPIITPRFSTEFDLGGLHTHPDLGSALNMAAIGLPHTAGLIAGYQVLVNSAGIIFAVAISMAFLAVRLPSTVRPTPSACPVPGHPEINFGEDWVSVTPWDKESLAQILADSLDYVNQLSQED